MASFTLLSLSLLLPAAVFGECLDGTLPNGSKCPLDPPNMSLTYVDPEHCSQYYECYNGCMNLLTCKPGQLYDEEHGWCESAGLVNCGERPCDGRPCDNSSPPTPGDFKCPEPWGYFANPDNCIKFYICQNGVPVEEVCPIASGQQEYYNPVNNQCDFPERVDCGDRPVCDRNDENCGQVTEPVTRPTADPSISTEHPPEHSCHGVTCHAGEDLLPEGHCEECFCQCANMKPVEICCEEGLLFNEEAGVCDFPFNLPECM